MKRRFSQKIGRTKTVKYTHLTLEYIDIAIAFPIALAWDDCGNSPATGKDAECLFFLTNHALIEYSPYSRTIYGAYIFKYEDKS